MSNPSNINQILAPRFRPSYIPLRRTHNPFPTQRQFATLHAVRQDVFHAQVDDPVSSAFLNHLQSAPQIPQTLTEKIVQKSSVGLAEGRKVKSGDYVFLKPSKVMTHDNSWLKLSNNNPCKIKSDPVLI